jgi:hypothetical protein
VALPPFFSWLQKTASKNVGGARTERCTSVQRRNGGRPPYSESRTHFAEWINTPEGDVTATTHFNPMCRDVPFRQVEFAVHQQRKKLVSCLDDPGSKQGPEAGIKTLIPNNRVGPCRSAVHHSSPKK